MANEVRLIDANALLKEHCGGCSLAQQKMCENDPLCGSAMWIIEAPTVDAVELVHIEKAKQEILQGFDVLIENYQHISQSRNDHFGIKAEAMEIAKRLVNAALTDLCDNCGEVLDGGNEDG